MIGEKLRARQARGELEFVSGRAFLLQIVPDLDADELECFVCSEDPFTILSATPGSPEFVALYREGGAAPCSWAGPDWERFPPGGDPTPRIWACERCPDGVPFHDGIHLLWSNGEVEFLSMEEIPGADFESGLIQLGEGSKDPRLATMRVDPDKGT